MNPPSKRLRTRVATLAAAVALVAGAVPAAACDVCYGASSDSTMVSSARLGVILLLGVTAGVLSGFLAFVVHLRNRARQFESERIASEWAQLQRSPLS